VSLCPGGEYGGSLPLSGGLSGNACLKNTICSRFLSRYQLGANECFNFLSKFHLCLKKSELKRFLLLEKNKKKLLTIYCLVPSN